MSFLGVAFGDIDLHLVWQAWHLVTSTFTLCGRRGTYGTQLALVTRLGPGGAASLCVAGVAFGDIDLHFVWQAWHLWHSVWQAWHLVTSTFTLCGRRVWHSAGSGDALGSRGRRVTLCGRRRIWRHRPAPCVAGLALGDIHFVWQAWHSWHSAGSGDALGSRARCVTLCGRRGIWRHRPSPCVTGLALGDIDHHFVWQAWHLWHSAGSGAFTLCGRRGIYGNQLGLVARLGPGGAASLCVAGVGFGDIDLHFVWQAWHLWHSAGSGDALGSRGRRVTLSVWQAWHLETSTCTLCGRRGTLCVAGVALMALSWLW
eukprot:s4817_g4.t1